MIAGSGFVLEQPLLPPAIPLCIHQSCGTEAGSTGTSPGASQLQAEPVLAKADGHVRKEGLDPHLL